MTVTLQRVIRSHHLSLSNLARAAGLIVGLALNGPEQKLVVIVNAVLRDNFVHHNYFGVGSIEGLVPLGRI